MGSTEEVIETRGGYRVVIDVEQGPAEPYDDFQSPLLRIDVARYDTRAEHIQTGGRLTGDDERIEEAARRWGGPNGTDWKLFEKYLRAYYGVTQIETYWSETYWYVTYDSAAWRKYVGFDGALAPEEDGKGKASLEEYKAWCEGEVYDYAVQKLVTWRAVNPETDDPDYAEYPDRDTWEDTEYTCGGLYGYECAVQAAKEALDEAAPKS